MFGYATDTFVSMIYFNVPTMNYIVKLLHKFPVNLFYLIAKKQNNKVPLQESHDHRAFTLKVIKTLSTQEVTCSQLKN